MMITYEELEDGGLSGGGYANIPTLHKEYARVLALVEIGEAEITPYSVTWEQLNAERLSQLAAIDLKSIRALREGDAVRVAALEAEAQAIRDAFEDPV